MSIDSLKKAVQSIEEELQEQLYPAWPQLGTKEWFKHYAKYILDCSKSRIRAEKAEEIHSALAKFDPKFASLCKGAHDAAIEFMDYVASKAEPK